MPTYKCTNKECTSFEKEIFVATTRIVAVGYSVYDKAAPCPDCKEYRETVKTDGYTTQIHGGENIAKL